MKATALRELSLDRHVELARRAIGAEVTLAVCDGNAGVAWVSDPERRPVLERAVAQLNERGFDRECPDTGVGVAAPDEAGLLVRAPISAGRLGRIGWLVAWVSGAPPGSAARDEATLGGTLTALAGCVGNEYRLTHEVDDLSGELSARYEELNVVYSLEGHAARFQRGHTAIRSLLESFADSLALDLVALLPSSRRPPLYAARPSQPIPDLDLVLTQLRSELLRFVRVRNTAVVLNRRDDPRRRYLLPHAPYHLIACPVDLGESRAALALLRHADRPAFTNGDRSLAQVIATQTAILLRNQAMLERLEKFGSQMAGALIEAVEAKDPYTRGHSERVQQISVHLGRELGMQEERVEAVFWGALLHDVGKIAVPDAILAKPCRLSEEEWDFVRLHPERSFEIIRSIEYLSPEALDGARYHQERFDGTGYPHGLKGEEIPYAARVIAVADTYDAITSSRSYRPARDHDTALEAVREAAGTQLDPAMVQVFDRLCRVDARWLLEISVRQELGDG